MHKIISSLFLASFIIMIGCGEIDDPSPVNEDDPTLPDTEGSAPAAGWVSDHDETFNSGSGFVKENGSTSMAFSIIPYNEDQMLVGNLLGTSYNGTPIGLVCRINEDGSLDTSFDSRQSFKGDVGSVHNMQILRDGKILVVGRFTANNAQSTQNVAILNPDGSLDTSFSTDGAGLSGNGLFACAEDSQGRILVGGFIFDYNKDYSYGKVNLFRFNRNGTLDTSFPSTFNAEVDDIKFDANNRLWVVGRFTKVNGLDTRYVAILNEDGSLYKTNSDLNEAGSFGDGAFSVDFQKDGKAIVDGAFTYRKNGNGAANVTRFNNDLTLDETFDYTYGLTYFADDWMRRIFVTKTDDILVTGYFSPDYLGLLNPDGSLSETFDASEKIDGYTNDVLVDGEGRIYVVGSFHNYGDALVNGIVRLKGISK
jgi:uncharacterized delta-60 repeat protein